MRRVGWEAAELGRLLYTHQIDVEVVASALQLTMSAARALVHSGMLPSEAGDDAHFALVLNILVRLEVRCGHDSVALRAALTRPLEQLGGASITDRLGQACKIEDLRALRDAAGNVPVPKVKLWRVADRYS